MASNKRRKLNKPLETIHMSAFAARQQAVKSEEVQDQVSPFQNEDRSVHPHDDVLFQKAAFVGDETAAAFRAGSIPEMDSRNNGPWNDANISDSPSYDDEATEIENPDADIKGESSANPRSVTSHLQQMSTVNPNGISYKHGSLFVKIGLGERLVVLGEFGLSVVKGQISILGATLPASNTVYPVYALLSHSLPVIRSIALDDAETEVQLHQLDNGLSKLRRLSPLFGKLGYDSHRIDSKTGLEKKTPQEMLSFRILHSSNNGPHHALLQRMVSPPEWNELLASTSSKFQQGNKTAIMTCGPKSSGKSTFCKLLVNRLLISTNDKERRKLSKQTKSGGVMFLDLDPGQPEYSPPGQLSLVLVFNPNFGPPYTHPESSTPSTKTLRAHSIVAVSPVADLSHYLDCVSDLLSHSHQFISSNPSCPLVINTPGWILGTGLEILIDLIKKGRPTDIIYMSTKGPWDVVEALKKAAKPVPIFTIPSQLSEYSPRNAADLRAMQYMSYFHLSTARNVSSLPTWYPNSLTSMPPWEVRYGGSKTGILGILRFGEKSPPEMLKDAINGTLVAVVVIDDTTAISNLHDKEHTQTSDLFDEDLTDQDVLSMRLNHFITRTPEENLPYFDPELPMVLSPTASRTIGIALIRGIDVVNQTIQLLTPIPTSIIKECSDNDKPIILVSGKLDTPGWAYTEELYQKVADEKASGAPQSADISDSEVVDADEQNNSDMDSSDNYGEGLASPPWVEILQGRQGRGTGRVWRVRRDLGRNGNGRE